MGAVSDVENEEYYLYDAETDDREQLSPADEWLEQSRGGRLDEFLAASSGEDTSLATVDDGLITQEVARDVYDQSPI
jgi:hypothetical protein